MIGVRTQRMLILLQNKQELVKIISGAEIILWISIFFDTFSVDNSVENIVTRKKYFSLVFYMKKIVKIIIFKYYIFFSMLQVSALL
jgi:hypothetical protein